MASPTSQATGVTRDAGPPVEIPTAQSKIEPGKKGVRAGTTPPTICGATKTATADRANGGLARNECRGSQCDGHEERRHRDQRDSEGDHDGEIGEAIQDGHERGRERQTE